MRLFCTPHSCASKRVIPDKPHKAGTKWMALNDMICFSLDGECGSLTLLAAAPALHVYIPDSAGWRGIKLHGAAHLVVEVHAEGDAAVEGQLGLVGGVGVGGGSGGDPAVLMVNLGIDAAIPNSLGHDVLRVLDRGQPWAHGLL